MKRRLCKILALCLCAAMLLSGCGLINLEELLAPEPVPFSEMEYTRPDLSKVKQAAAGVEEKLDEKAEIEPLMDSVYAFYEEYHKFYTNYSLANIHYFKDMTDLYWDEEYAYCLDVETEASALLDQLLYKLADCPLREELEAEEYFGPGFFDDYEGESLWDAEFTALMDQEAELLEEYYTLSAKSLELPEYTDAWYKTYGDPLAELYAELIILRKQIAAYAGYEDYLSFAYDFYYYRDYTPAQAKSLMEQIRTELVPLYQKTATTDIWYLAMQESSREQTFAYVKDSADAMGGTVKEAFRQLEKNGLYDISYGENKYNASFEVYLSAYYSPYIFVNPTMRVHDKLTFAHEFGHFCNDYASYGTVAGVDVAEVFSQGMEYLSLCYGKDTDKLEILKMADSLSVYVEQALYASFEHQAYEMENPTGKGLYELFAQVGKDFGFSEDVWDGRNFVYVPHFFTNPLYIISYVVSNDAAMQIYQLERQEKGKGLALLEENLTTEEGYFLAFVESAGLQSPFAEGRVASVRKLLEELL